MKIVSVGYEKRTLSELGQILSDHGATALFDVRELPLSRKKGFSKRALEEGLKERGIKYHHAKYAGNPFRKEAKRIEYCLGLYRNHLSENPEVIQELIDHVDKNIVVGMLCYEREHHNCHRSILIEALGESGVEFVLAKEE